MDLSSRDSAIKFGMGRYRQASGLLEQLGDELSRFGNKALVIAGERSWGAVRDRLVPVFEESKIETSLVIWKGACCAEGARELSDRAAEIDAHSHQRCPVRTGGMYERNVHTRWSQGCYMALWT